MRKNIQVGWAQTSITPDHPTYNMGQIYPRISRFVHDPITATCLVIENGEEQVTFLSFDMVSVPTEGVLSRVRANLACEPEIDPMKLSVNVTHTHNSLDSAGIFDRIVDKLNDPDLEPRLNRPDDLMAGKAIEDFLVDRATELVLRAWRTRKPGAVAGAGDYACVAFNRRPVFKDGDGEYAKMYGCCASEDFLRYEGGSDHSIEMIYTFDEADRLTGALVCVPCPSQVFELHHLTSADYWGYARAAIRERLGNIYVLSMCGPAGDQNPLDLTRISKDNVRELVEWNAQADQVWRNIDMAEECRDIAERIADAVKRAYKKAVGHIDPAPIFKHETRSLSLPLRKVSKEDYEEAQKEYDEKMSKFTKEHPMTGADLVAVFEPQGVVSRWHAQQTADTYDFDIHALRIGDAALVTNPFELFCEYGFRIKARAKSHQTILVQLSNGRGGYLPTRAAIEGGSYSSKPASTNCDADGGDCLVEETLKMIDEIWR